MMRIVVNLHCDFYGNYYALNITYAEPEYFASRIKVEFTITNLGP